MIHAPKDFVWSNYGAYRSFDSFLQKLVIERQSFITNHEEKLDLEGALSDIKLRFVDDFDKGKKNFDLKAKAQFQGASENTLIVFAHAEYLWAMPSATMKPSTKRNYAERWFGDDSIKTGKDFYFWQRDGIANPGQYYQTNKYQELRSVFRVLHHLVTEPPVKDLAEAKERIATLCYETLYGTATSTSGFEVDDYCGVNAALLHLSKPDHFQSILSKGNKQEIISFFDYLIEDCTPDLGIEERLNLIKDRVYLEHDVPEDDDFKFRYFFYCPAVKNLWRKGTAGLRNQASIYNEIFREELAPSPETEEGERIEVLGNRIYRCPKIVKKAKERDSYACQACGFYFKKQIVHVHHLNPLHERQSSETTVEDDLVTLCPNCHYLAHYLLRRKNGNQCKDKQTLLKKLQTTLPPPYQPSSTSPPSTSTTNESSRKKAHHL